MEWKDVGKAVAGAAPALGAALGGPVGAAAGALVASVFGVDSKSPDAVAEAVKADPDAAVKLRQIELDHATAIRAMEADELKAQFSDVQNARAMHQDHWMPAALTIVLALLVASFVAASMVLTIPKDNGEVIYLVVGQVVGAFATAIAYWLGSSRGSAIKQNALMHR